jgi:hypothetical protein
MILLGTTALADQTCAMLARWSAEGLVEPFVRWLDDGSACGQAELVAGGERRAVSLAEALAGVEVARLQVIGLAIGTADGLDEANADALEKLMGLLYSRSGIPLLPAETYRLPAMVLVPAGVGAPLPAALFSGSFHPIVLVSPEDRAAPRTVNALTVGSEVMARHAAHAVAALCDMYRGVPPQALPTLADIAGQTPPGRLRVVRSFTRTIDAGFLADQVAARALRPQPKWPNPDRSRFADRELAPELTAALLDELMKAHAGVLGLTVYQPVTIPPPVPMSIWAAINAIWNYVVDRVRRAPAETLDRVVGRGYDRVATFFEKRAPEGSGVKRVLRWAERDPSQPAREFVESQLATVPFAEAEGAVGPAWRDLISLTLGLADGGDLPSPLRTDFLTSGGTRLIVRDPSLLAPGPEPPPLDGGVAPSGGAVRTCDPARWEALGQGADKQQDAAGVAFGHWLERVRPSLLWQLGVRLAANLETAARECAIPGPDQPGAPDQAAGGEGGPGGGDKPGGAGITAPAAGLNALGAASSQVARDTGNARRRFLLRGLVLNTLLLVALVVATALAPLAWWCVPPLILAEMALWLVLAARSWRHRDRAVRAAEEYEAQTALEELNALALRTVRQRDAERLQRRYDEYLDWSEILSVLLHRPLAGRAVDQYPRVRSLRAADFPQAWAYRVAVARDATLMALSNRAKSRLFQPGWLGELESVVDRRVREDRARSLTGTEPTDAAVLPDPTSDTSGAYSADESPRRWFLDGVLRGTHRGVDDSPLAYQLVRFVTALRPEEIAQDLGPCGGDDGRLAPSAAWMDRPAGLDYLAASVRPAVVRVLVTDGRPPGGTAVVVGSEGVAVTSRRTARTGTAARVQLHDGTWADASVEATGPPSDLVLVKFAPPAGLSAAVPGTTGELLIGSPVFSLGYPDAATDRPVLSWGLVTAKSTSSEGTGAFVQIGSAPVGGGPGTPVFDLDGRLVGVVATAELPLQDEPPPEHVTRLVPAEAIIQAVKGERAPAPQVDDQPEANVAAVGYFATLLSGDVTSFPPGLLTAGTAAASGVERVICSDATYGDASASRDGAAAPEGSALCAPLRWSARRCDVSASLRPEDLSGYRRAQPAPPTGPVSPTDDLV